MPRPGSGRDTRRESVAKVWDATGVVTSLWSVKPDSDDPLVSQHVRRALAGDLESLAAVVERFTPLLLAQASYRLGTKLKRFADPEDVVNDVWARALPRLSTIEVREGRMTPVLVKFLSIALLRRVRDLFEKHVLGKKLAEAAEGVDTGDPLAALPAEQSGVVTRAVKKERQGLLAAAIDGLPPNDREVLVLRGIEMRTNQEVAAMLEIDADAASTRYRRALARLEESAPKSLLRDFMAD